MSFKTHFRQKLHHLLPDITNIKKIAIGVSGGPDSMALAGLLSGFAEENGGPEIFLLTVDHQLRAESAQEAKMVAEQVQNWPYVTHRILNWENKKPETGLLEAARQARYDLMARLCEQENIHHLFLAHHRDDQAETFLIRLCKGSGLDGLAGMNPVQNFGNLVLIRPLLDIPKDDLIAFCQQENIQYATDPTNVCQDYLRPRLRSAQEVLEKEGLNTKRLSVTASRLGRARQALEEITHQAFEDCAADQIDRAITLDTQKWHAWPEEIRLRVLLKAIHHVRGLRPYGPRLEKVEELLDQIENNPDFKRTTLANCIFARTGKGEALLIEHEDTN